MNISGTTHPSFAPLRETFASLWDDIEVGASLSVMLQGQTVVDLWGGHLDPDQQISWQADTLVNIYSSTKGIMAMAVACLVNDGALKLEDPICHHWPEFGAEKKFDITVADLMCHRTGMFETGLTDPESLLDWTVVTQKLAAMKPAWQPGEGYGYHAVSWGYLVGELIYRITGKLPGDYIKERITDLLEAEFFLGLPESEFSRTASLIGPNRSRKPQPSRDPVEKELSATDPILSPYKHLCSQPFREAQIPATNGHASARGLARCYFGFIKNLLTTANIREAFTIERTQGEVDKVLGTQVRRSYGFILNNDDVPMGPSHNSFGHSGTGGSIAFADPDNELVFAYVMNQLAVDGKSRYQKLIDATYECLKRNDNE